MGRPFVSSRWKTEEHRDAISPLYEVVDFPVPGSMRLELNEYPMASFETSMPTAIQRKVILPSFYDFQYLTTVRQSTGDKSNVHHATLVC